MLPVAGTHMDLTPYLDLMLKKQGSNLILTPNNPVKLRLAGKDKPVGKDKLTNDLIKTAAFALMNKEQLKVFQEKKHIAFDYSPEDIGGDFIVKLTLKDKSLVLIISIPEIKAREEVTITENKPSPKSEQPKKPMVSKETGDGHFQVLGAMPQGNLDLLPYLATMIERDASDLFITVESPVKAKISGRAIKLDEFLLTPELTKSAAYGIMTDEQIEEFERTHDLDFAIEMPDGSGRFRVNAFYQRKTVGLVLRLIPSVIPDAKAFGTPEILLELVMAKRGLLLMVGGTGSGKSTTLAAMINHRNENSPGHILTIEDPVEFSHPNKMSIVNQREVGIDTASYARALKASLREAPDVILIGEIRERETMESALELANTGHLCVSTMHANNANQAMERVINMFPNEMHKQLFMDLSLNLRAVISQRLIPDVRGKRCAAIEVMINTPHIASLILKGEIEEIKEAMVTSGTKGMKAFDDALYDLYKNGKISLEEALKNADSRNNLEAKINFG